MDTHIRADIQTETTFERNKHTHTHKHARTHTHTHTRALFYEHISFHLWILDSTLILSNLKRFKVIILRIWENKNLRFLIKNK